MKLISMKDYVIEFSNVLNSAELRKYAEFLDQPLTLGMFVTCGGDGYVLEEPNEKDEQFYGAYGISNLNKAKNKYQAAKDRVLFEGFNSIKDVEDFSFTLGEFINFKSKVEHLLGVPRVEFNLTKSAIKQLRL